MLTDKHCKAASCPMDATRVRLTDAGGLYLETTPNQKKRWFFKYRFANVEKRLALGTYPEISLMAARKARDLARLQKGDGQDPGMLREVEKLKASNPHGDSFKVVALEWFEKQSPMWSDSHASRSRRQFERDIFPWIGKRRLSEIEPVELLAVLRKTEQRGAVETADRGLMLCRQVWRYGVATGRVTRDITSDLKGALTPYRGRHLAAITDPVGFGDLIRAIREYRGGLIVRAALQLSPLLFQRPGELRGAAWTEIDLEGALWTIPSQRMKREKDGKQYGSPHYVPLSRQAVEILRGLHGYTGHGTLVFPGERNHDRCISENSVRTALLTMGYSSDIHTWHGFRASARTMLAERMDIDPLLIEAQLAHSVRDANGRSYNRTQYLSQRHVMMQQWADYLDRLASTDA